MQNEPFPDPSTLSPLDRIKIINRMRSEQNEGIEHSEAQLSWMLSLVVLERQASTSRSSSTSAAKSTPIPTKLEDL